MYVSVQFKGWADKKGPLKASAGIFISLALTLLLFGFAATNKYYVIPLVMICMVFVVCFRGHGM